MRTRSHLLLGWICLHNDDEVILSKLGVHSPHRFTFSPGGFAKMRPGLFLPFSERNENSEILKKMTGLEMIDREGKSVQIEQNLQCHSCRSVGDKSCINQLGFLPEAD